MLRALYQRLFVMVQLMLHWIMPTGGWCPRKPEIFTPQMSLSWPLILELHSVLTCTMRQYEHFVFHQTHTKRRRVLKREERDNNRSRSWPSILQRKMTTISEKYLFSPYQMLSGHLHVQPLLMFFFWRTSIILSFSRGDFF